LFTERWKKRFLVVLSALYVLAGSNLYPVSVLLIADQSVQGSARAPSADAESNAALSDHQQTDAGCSCGHCHGPTGGECACTNCVCGEQGSSCAVSVTSGTAHHADPGSGHPSSNFVLSSCTPSEPDEHADGVTSERHTPVRTPAYKPAPVFAHGMSRSHLLLPTGVADTPDHVPRSA
jgi:hypothetical protein